MIPIPSRKGYAGLALVTIVLGLYGRGAGEVRDFAGDALWGMMTLWLSGFLAPRAPLAFRTAAALTFCFAIETSQLYRAPWLNALRKTTLGELVLGSGFDARDFLAYGVGIAVAVVIEVMLRRSPASTSA